MVSATSDAADELRRITHKSCSKCARVLPAAQFNKANWLPSGLRSDCKECYAKLKRSIWLARPTSAAAERRRKNQELKKAGLRQCIKCAEVKPLDGFSKHKSGHLETCCRKCVAIRTKQYIPPDPEGWTARASMRNMERYAKMRDRTPRWLTSGHRDEIAGFYAEARRLTQKTGILHHVDHIYPLIGRGACGLHVPWNLQILTGSENCQKSNKAPHEDERPLARSWFKSPAQAVSSRSRGMGGSHNS